MNIYLRMFFYFLVVLINFLVLFYLLNPSIILELAAFVSLVLAYLYRFQYLQIGKYVDMANFLSGLSDYFAKSISGKHLDYTEDSVLYIVCIPTYIFIFICFARYFNGVAGVSMISLVNFVVLFVLHSRESVKRTKS